MRPNRPTHIIVHCSDSPWGDASVIDEWHRARGFHGIGYHYVIPNGRIRARTTLAGADGALEAGRPETVEGAHCKGFNRRSVGICLIGRGDYTPAQMATLRDLVRGLMARHRIPAAHVLGHGEADPRANKPCPLMDMAQFRASLEAPDAAA